MSAKPDFRQTLNLMLGIYYERKGAVFMHKEVHDANIPVHQADVSSGITTLLNDGHIEQVAPGFSAHPIAAITGSGRIFYEQGGYQENTTRFDKVVRWAKNHIIVAWILLAFLILTSVSGIISIVLQLAGI